MCSGKKHKNGMMMYTHALDPACLFLFNPIDPKYAGQISFATPDDKRGEPKQQPRFDEEGAIDTEEFLDIMELQPVSQEGAKL